MFVVTVSSQRHFGFGAMCPIPIFGSECWGFDSLRAYCEALVKTKCFCGGFCIFVDGIWLVAVNVGKVFLVGGGPGDPGLLTLRGAECLKLADLVLYDGLVNPQLLRHTTANAIRTCRVFGAGEKYLDQAEINQELIEAAQSGKVVVRLKGGDPFIFGRGSEEAAALADAGIPFEVVPGVTAAIAAGEYAGISFTHREYSSAVAFITGHEDPSKPTSVLEYASLANFPGTLVFYMGLNRLPTIVESLIQAGKNCETPVAVVSQASLPQQQTVSGTLSTIVQSVASAGLRPPSLIIVGECVKHRERIAWFEQRPLFGRRIGITRADEQADPQIKQIFELGAEPVLMPSLQFDPPETWATVDETLSQVHEFDWLIFTSANGVRAFFERLWKLGRDMRSLGQAQLATIGPATAEALREYHLQADLIPETYSAEGLATALRPAVSGKRVLWVRADRGRDVLSKELSAAGATFHELVVYRHKDITEWPPNVVQRLVAGQLDWICVSSPAIAKNVARLIPEAARQHIGQSLRIATISPLTSAACREVGMIVSAEATEHTFNGILSAIVNVEQNAASRVS